jgi:hypothetical protein
MLQQAARPPAITTTVHDRIMRAVAAVSAKAVAAAMLRQRSASLRLRQARPRKFDDLRIGSGRRAATEGIATHIVRTVRESLGGRSAGQDDMLPLLQPVATGPPGDVLAGALDTGRLTRQVKRPIFDR